MDEPQHKKQTLLEFLLLQNLSTHGGQLNFERGGDPKGITINGVGDPSKLLHPLRGGGVFIGILKNMQMCIKKESKEQWPNCITKPFKIQT
jgi:hypothetical protein